jgi:hypothetical protein
MKQHFMELYKGMHVQLHALLTSAVDVGEQSGSPLRK